MSLQPCPVCSQPVQDTGIGRPRTFCSPGCRRTAEAEVRRLDRRLAALEVERDGMAWRHRRDDLDAVPKDGRRRRRLHELELAANREAHAEATARLRTLFTAIEGATT